jgi:DNA-binding PadR family transcriptional regulator
MAARRTTDNLLGLAVLGYLTQRPMYPYELSRTLRDNDDARSVKFSHGSLYMVVNQLTKAGLIAEQETSREGQRPERTLYAITDTGRGQFREWLARLLAEPQYEYPQFVAALSLIAALPPDQVVDLLTARLARLTEQRAQTRGVIDQALAGELHPLFLIEEEYRIAMLEAETAFVTGFIDKITNPDTGWGPLWAQFHSPPPTEGHIT